MINNIIMNRVLDILFPKSCYICSKEGTYLCARCKKLFKRNLPECYICRRLSRNFSTHTNCMNDYSLDFVYICWEYNSFTSKILKKYKYSYVYDISDTLSSFFIEIMKDSEYIKTIENSLITTVPISSSRMRERGFNQLSFISKNFCNTFNLHLDENILFKMEDSEHQASKCKEERRNISSKAFTLSSKFDIGNYKSITIIDDVITTGSTLESIAECIKAGIGKDISVNSICLFRGKPNYSSVSEESSDFLLSSV